MTSCGSAGLATAFPRPAPPRLSVRHPVVAATLLAALLLLLWALLLANDAGDLAAQYAWTQFTRQNPDSAYNLSWYGGMHTASYSVLSPYLMSWLGVRTTGVLAGTLSAGLAAWLLVRSGVTRPLPPALWTAVALWCDVASGRVTFALGVVFGLAATLLLFPPVQRGAWRAPALFALATLATLATLGSPVVGLFLEVVAAALFLGGRRREAWALATGPVLVVAGTSLLFPFYGVQPFDWWAAAPVIAVATTVALVAPRAWRTVRHGAAVYAVGVALVWAVPSPIGSNVDRLSLLFAGSVLLAAALDRGTARPGLRPRVIGVIFLAVAAWLVVKTVGDLVTTVPVSATAKDAGALIGELRQVGADRGRVEVVPLRSHWEASGLAPYVDLARGWNRQADVTRNPLFYDDTLTPDTYHAWLLHWSVGYVVLPSGIPDDAAQTEAALVAAGPSWLEPVWRDPTWRLYRVADAQPLAAPPASVQRAGAAALTVDVPAAGPVLLRIPWSPWLAIAGADGTAHGCLAEAGDWTLLRAPGPGTYQITGRYALSRGTPCRSD